ncbi:DUF423 domain-containing protein [Pontimicrobium sp. IMCC45349]|uniref:DUF423 domain-containing protein n=1 Tax=Pontimicrobium sp. IMCC45349 TaxID=3391574 RepID=UPI0039A2F1C1
MNKKILILACLLGMLAVVLGAFAAHGLEKMVDAAAIDSFKTGVRYQMYHAIFLLFVGSSNYVSEKSKKTIFYLVLIGVLFFSGSIYGLATNDYSGFNFKTIALITPVGGLLLISAWLVMLINMLKIKTE